MKKLYLFLFSFGLLLAGVAHATTVFNSNQVGTSPVAGSVLQTNGATSTWVTTSSLGISGGGGSATTTINNTLGPVFTFSIVPTSSQSSITTGTAAIFFNVLNYTSGTDINVATNGVINFVNTPGFISTSTGLTTANFASANISQWTNNSGYITTSTYNASTSIATTGPLGGGGSITNGGTLTLTCATCLTTAGGYVTSTITIGTSTASNVFNVTSSGNTIFHLTIPSNVSYFTNDAGYVTSTTVTAAGTSTDIQLNNNGSLGSDTGVFQENTSTHQLTLSAPTSSVVIGSSTYFATSSVVTVTTESYTGASSSITIPVGVSSVLIYAVGGGDISGSANADAGQATGTLAVIPGEILYYDVGAAGQNGGYPGGATGVNGGSTGGGMSWVSTSTSFGTSTVLVVGPGSGGNGENNGNAGGYGGGTTGGTGGGSGGAGGTQSAGGSPNGSAGQGGAGSGGNAAGGGGGGYYGGGGGSGSNQAGGGGSAYLNPILTATSTTSSTNTGNGSIIFTYTKISSGLTGNNLGLGVSGVIITGGSTPTVSAATGGSTIIGNNTVGAVTNSSSTASFTVTFSTSTPYSNPAWFNAPDCDVHVSSGTGIAFKVAESTSSFIATPTSNLATGTISKYICLGY